MPNKLTAEQATNQVRDYRGTHVWRKARINPVRGVLVYPIDPRGYVSGVK